MWEAEKYQAPPELQSKILTRPSKKPLKGIPIKQSLERYLGFETRERVVDGDVEFGAWMSTNILGHEVAIMRDTLGAHGRFHHAAFFYGIQQHNIDAAEMFREHDITIEPDFEMRTWSMSDIDTGLAIGGAKLPWETYFTYGTPPTKPLAEHLADAPQPPAPPAAEPAPAAVG